MKNQGYVTCSIKSTILYVVLDHTKSFMHAVQALSTELHLSPQLFFWPLLRECVAFISLVYHNK